MHGIHEFIVVPSPAGHAEEILSFLLPRIGAFVTLSPGTPCPTLTEATSTPGIHREFVAREILTCFVLFNLFLRDRGALNLTIPSHSISSGR
jgi:hypothetical protein